MTGSDVNEEKQTVRARIWSLLEQANVVPAGVHGHIPAFVGADAAADRLAGLPAWRAARTIMANPDRAQLPVRAAALASGKLLYMAVPRLATMKPFYMLDPVALAPPYETTAASDGARRVAPTVGLEQMRPVDLIVCGSVAVNRSGARIGKGAGYSDLEVALLTEAGLIGRDTTIVTTVHRLQVVDAELPETEYDFRVDLIATPGEVIDCGPPRRPSRVARDRLRDEQVNAIPVIRTTGDRRTSAPPWQAPPPGGAA